MKQAIILMGLPLAGKSEWIKKNFEGSDTIVVSADTLKESHIQYDPESPELIHEWSVQEAERLMIMYAEQGVETIVMDGGSINNSYTVRIIEMLQHHGYDVKLVHIKTPLNVCLERLTNRRRKVPVQDIIDKAAKEHAQFLRLLEYVDEYEIVEYFTHKNIFVDMDGVVAGQSTLPKIMGKLDFVNSQFFRYLPPVMPVIQKLEQLQNNGYTLRILSATPNSFSHAEKLEWLEKYMPFMGRVLNKDIFFVNSGKHKAEMLLGLTKYLKLDKQDVTLIDDAHDTISQVDILGMRPMHPSEFLAYKFTYNGIQ